jgi:uncharacterized membrane protein
MTPSSTRSSPLPRVEALDALRGLAMVWMTVFHLCFDLVYFGVWKQDFYGDPLWTWQRTCIVGLFLFTAGMSQTLAVQGGQDWARFGRRWLQIAACAVLVSLGSWWMFPQSWIYFGVLHGVAIMLIVARWLALRGLSTPALVALAAAALVVHLGVQVLGAAWSWPETFNTKALSWLGLNWKKPITEDFVPVLPWIGVMLLGLVAGRHLPERMPTPPALGWLGRRSLAYYMLHQPVMIGLLWLLFRR